MEWLRKVIALHSRVKYHSLRCLLLLFAVDYLSANIDVYSVVMFFSELLHTLLLIYQTINQSINQTINHTIDQSIDTSMNNSINQSINQSNNQSIQSK